MYDSIPRFQAYGPAHLTVLALTVVIPTVLIPLARGAPSPSVAHRIGWAIAAVLLINKLTVFFYACWHNTIPWLQRLPMHLCDWTTFIAAAALIWRRQTLYELAWFWGLVGTLQAVITPDLAYGFPHFYFFTFNISHSGIVIAAFFLTLGMGMRPQWRSLLRAFGWLQFYLLCACLANWLLDTNYGYLCYKPSNPSLLDHLGSWPWYILSLETLAVIFFVLLYAPFAIADTITKREKQRLF
jgi:hypothetical integral membrane protein (TIGR02206 family)